MLDTEVDKPRKAVERKKHSWVINILKESVSTTTIINHILDLGVNLTTGELLVSTLAIEKQLTKTIIEDKAI